VYDYVDRLIAGGRIGPGGLKAQPHFQWTSVTSAPNVVAQLKSSFKTVDWEHWWAYDDVGNMTFSSDVGTYTYPAAGTVPADGPISVGDSTLSYWPNGAEKRVKSRGKETTYAYDGDDQLVEVRKGGRTVQFVYDLDGRRIERSGGGEKQRAIWIMATSARVAVAQWQLSSKGNDSL